jgi:hypothetical protein
MVQVPKMKALRLASLQVPPNGKCFRNWFKPLTLAMLVSRQRVRQHPHFRKNNCRRAPLARAKSVLTTSEPPP